jgi:hypothetical protein
MVLRVEPIGADAWWRLALIAAQRPGRGGARQAGARRRMPESPAQLEDPALELAD